MHVNTDSGQPARKPCIRDFHNLTIGQGALLPFELVMLVPLAELERRAQEINATHPHFQEETPLVVQWERQRRARLSGRLEIAVNQTKVA